MFEIFISYLLHYNCFVYYRWLQVRLIPSSEKKIMLLCLLGRIYGTTCYCGKSVTSVVVSTLIKSLVQGIHTRDMIYVVCVNFYNQNFTLELVFNKAN